MGEILKFPVQATKLGYKRVKKRAQVRPENPEQLILFPPPTAEILYLMPGSSRFEQALLFDEQGDLKAAELYRKAIQEGDCVADAYCNLGIIESKQGNITKAFDCFTISLKHNPRHSESHYNLGNLYFDVNDFRLAQIHFELAAEVDPSFPNVYFNLALVQAINNELGPAVAALTKYQKLVSAEEGRKADEFLHNLLKSLALAKDSRFRSP